MVRFCRVNEGFSRDQRYIVEWYSGSYHDSSAQRGHMTLQVSLNVSYKPSGPRGRTS